MDGEGCRGERGFYCLFGLNHDALVQEGRRVSEIKFQFACFVTFIVQNEEIVQGH